MIRIVICILTLLIFLSPSTIKANNKFEADLFFGSYYPSFASALIRIEKTFYTLEIGTCNIQGFAFSYRITPNYEIRIQVDSSESEAQIRSFPTGIRSSITAVSMLGVLDLFQFQNHKLYSGFGLIDYQVKSKQPLFLSNYPSSKHDFGFPWGVMVLIGLATPPNQCYQVKGEIQYVMGADGELLGIPLDWDGPKFLVSFGIKF